MNPRRLYAPVVLRLLVAGGAAWVLAGRVWTSATLTTEGLPPDVVEVTGRQALPLAAALAVVVLTGALAVLATRGRVRQGIGLLVVLAAVIAGVAVMRAGAALDGALQAAVEESPAYTRAGGQPPADDTPWRWVTLVPFGLAALLGALVVRYARSWPAMSGRYEAPARRQESDDPWTALDEGRDPTL